MDEFPASSQGWNESSLHPSVFVLPPECVYVSHFLSFLVSGSRTPLPQKGEKGKRLRKSTECFAGVADTDTHSQRKWGGERFERREFLEQLCICISLSDWSYWIRSIRLQMYRQIKPSVFECTHKAENWSIHLWQDLTGPVQNYSYSWACLIGSLVDLLCLA